MAFAPDDASYLLASPNLALPNTRTLTSDPIVSNLQFNDSGPGGSFILSPTLNLLALTQVNTTGFLTYLGSNTFAQRTFASDGSITIANPAGVAGHPLFSVVDNTSVQQVNVSTGFTTSTRPTINLIAGADITISVVDNAGLDRADVTINAAGTAAGTVTSVAVTSPDLTVGGSPITSAGTITLDLNTVPISKGGTGQITQSAAFDALSPMTAAGDIIIGGALGFGTRLPAGTDGQALTIVSGSPAWTNDGGGTVTSVAATSTDLTITGSPITSSGTLDFTLNTVTTDKGGTGLTSYAAGDTVYYAAGTLLSKLAIGAANTVLASTGTAPNWVGGTAMAGQVLTYDGIDIVWSTNGTGTVSSVGLTQSASAFTITGSPVTSSGDINIDLNTVSIADGGTGQITQTAAFDALSPMTTLGDLILGGASGTGTRLGIGSAGNVLTVSGGTAVWTAPATSGTVTSVAATSSDITIGGSPITSSGTLTFTLNTVSIAKGGTGQITASAAFDALSPMTTAGDLIIGGASGTGTALPIGSLGQILTVIGGAPTWFNASSIITGSGILNGSGNLAVPDTSITANTVIFVSGVGDGVTNPANGPLTVVLNAGVDFTVSGAGAADAGNRFVYAIVAY